MTYANKSAKELAAERKATEAAKAPAPKKTTTPKE